MDREELKNEIEAWVSENIHIDYIKQTKPKVIRDPVHGLHKFNGWEVNFLDLPITQRLRNIKQNAFAYHIYPGAVQTRFDHTLGVAILTEKYIHALGNLGIKVLNEERRTNLRLAALFHDLGHGPFSHISEEIYSTMDPINKILKEPKYSAAYQNIKAHELISYFIIKSDAFKILFEQTDKFYKNDYNGHIDVDLISEAVIGNVSNKKYKYCQDIINGSFDADKLDYIQRDCYFTGIKMGLDVERIFQTIILKSNSKINELALDISGSHNLEQLLFNKLLMYPSLYHHHKVRACSCMFKSIFEIMWDNDIEIDGKKFDNPIDFLRSTDSLFYTFKNKDDRIKPIIKNIINRVILKRALVVAKDYLESDPEEIDLGYEKLLKWANDPSKMRGLRKVIADEIEGISYYDIWIDFPTQPSLREASQCSIKIRDDVYKTLDHLFPSDGWLNTYLEHKMKGYIFCPPKTEIREKVHEVSRRILLDEFGIRLTEDCLHQAKLR